MWRWVSCVVMRACRVPVCLIRDPGEEGAELSQEQSSSEQQSCTVEPLFSQCQSSPALSPHTTQLHQSHVFVERFAQPQWSHSALQQEEYKHYKQSINKLDEHRTIDPPKGLFTAHCTDTTHPVGGDTGAFCYQYQDTWDVVNSSYQNMFEMSMTHYGHLWLWYSCKQCCALSCSLSTSKMVQQIEKKYVSMTHYKRGLNSM